MPDTLKLPMFDLAHFEKDELAELRRELPRAPLSGPTRLISWAAVLLLGVAGTALARRLLRA